MNAIEVAVTLVAVAVVLSHCLALAAHLDRKRWEGHLYEFALFAASIALLGSGSVGVLLGWHHAVTMLILGVAGVIMMDRRKNAFLR